MGCNFVAYVSRRESKPQVKEEFEVRQEQDRYKNGHSYSGGIGMAQGLEFWHEKLPTFATGKEARAWLDDNCEKWGPAVAVKFIDGENGEAWLIGAACSS